jgi:teichuronic acid biosynthesis glycosyltransferase TuaG
MQGNCSSPSAYRRNKGGVPLVSIITPAYNAARFIVTTIESVRAQTYDNWEMIVVDDCSTDATCELVEQMAQQDKRIFLVKHNNNQGPAGARRTALARAEGRFVAFLDSDDLWLPSKLEKQLSFMVEKDTVLSFSQYRRIADNRRKIGQVISVPSELNYHDLLKNTAIVTSTVMIDRTKSGPLYMKDWYYDDYTLWLDVLRSGFTAHGLQEDLVRYRIVGKSVSRNKLKSAMWVWRTYKEVEKLDNAIAAWCFANYVWNALVKYRKF